MEVLHHEQMEKTIVLTEKGMHLAAFWSRLLCGCGTSGRFEPIFAMENILPVFDRTFNYRIVEKTEWKRPQCEAAFYIPAENEIVIRSDVYEGAMNGVAMDVITVAHEVVHYLQAIITRLLSGIKCVTFKTEVCRSGSEEMIHNENQTDRLTFLMFCPERLVQDKSKDQIVRQYFISPLAQLVRGLTKMAGKKLVRALTEFAKNKEGEKCAV